MLLLIYFYKHESGQLDMCHLQACITTINSDDILI